MYRVLYLQHCQLLKLIKRSGSWRVGRLFSFKVHFDIYHIRLWLITTIIMLNILYTCLLMEEFAEFMKCLHTCITHTLAPCTIKPKPREPRETHWPSCQLWCKHSKLSTINIVSFLTIYCCHGSFDLCFISNILELKGWVFVIWENWFYCDCLQLLPVKSSSSSGSTQDRAQSDKMCREPQNGLRVVRTSGEGQIASIHIERHEVLTMVPGTSIMDLFLWLERPGTKGITLSDEDTIRMSGGESMAVKTTTILCSRYFWLLTHLSENFFLHLG